jgi:hypothetical protein
LGKLREMDAARPELLQKNKSKKRAVCFNGDGPPLVDVVSNRLELSMPPNITKDQAVGFGMWAMKTVLNGGTELVDLAATNLFR